MEKNYNIPELPFSVNFDTVEIMRALIKANRALAELKGIAKTIPNEKILISSLSLQEAKDSTEIESIVTTHDELYRSDLKTDYLMTPAVKEVLLYREAVFCGFEKVKKNGILTNNIIREIQQKLTGMRYGFRSVPVRISKIENGTDKTVYIPPCQIDDIEKHMKNLELFINDPELSPLDPLIKLCIIHHQFESIHPFVDGNGRTGRIINVLYLVLTGLLDLPILYLSRFITHNKAKYYDLLQAIRDKKSNDKNWREYVIFMLRGIEETSLETIKIVNGISKLMQEYKQILRPAFGHIYKHELLNNLFFHPYTKVEYFENEMQVRRKTACKYLDKICELGLLKKQKIGKRNYYINEKLISFFLGDGTI